MANNKLSESAILDIQKTLAGRDDKASAYLAKELAEKYGVHKSQIYKITEEYRPKRKSRSDKGNRKVKLTDKDFLNFATQLVILEKMKPEDAYEKAKEKGFKVSIASITFRRHLEEDGLWLNEKIPKIEKVKKKKPTFVILDDDVAKIFNDSDLVNNVLRALIPTIQKQAGILQQKRKI